MINKDEPRHKKLQATLKELRKSQKVTQQELAEHLGKPQSFVSKYESGEQNIDVIQFVDICLALNLDPKKGFELIYYKIQ